MAYPTWTLIKRCYSKKEFGGLVLVAIQTVHLIIAKYFIYQNGRIIFRIFSHGDKFVLLYGVVATIQSTGR